MTKLAIDVYRGRAMTDTNKENKEHVSQGNSSTPKKPADMLKASLDMLKSALKNAKLSPQQVQSLGDVMADIQAVLSGQKTPKNLQDTLEDFTSELEKTFKKNSPCDPK